MINLRDGREARSPGWIAAAQSNQTIEQWRVVCDCYGRSEYTGYAIGTPRYSCLHRSVRGLEQVQLALELLATGAGEILAVQHELEEHD